MLLKSLVGLLSLTTSMVQAESSASCSFDDKTMTAAASVSQLNSCPTIEGKLEIGSGDGIGSIDLGEVEEIKGQVHIFNSSSVTDINLNGLKKVTGSLIIDALTQLHGIQLAQLSEVAEFNLISLPSLATLNMNTGISKGESMQISDTALSDLTGLVNSLNTVSKLNINNNKNITSIELPNLQSVSQNLILSFNGEDCDVVLDNMQWAANVTVQDAGSLSASSLEAVNGSLVLGYNTFETFELPAEEIGGSFQVFANDDLTSFEVANVTDIGGEVKIFNNSQLDDMSNSFSNLETIKGAVNVNGSFSNFTMASLEEVNGDFSVRSDNEDFDCEQFKELHSNKKIEGHNFKCVAPKKDSSSGSGASFETETFSGDDSGSGGGDDDDDSTSSEDAGTTLLRGSMVLATIFTTIFSVLV